MKRVYLDSNIFIAFIRGDMGKPFKAMYHSVETLFKRFPENHVLVLSGIFFNEVKDNGFYSRDETLAFFREYEIKVIAIESTEKDSKLANEFMQKGVHRQDAMHAAMAINNGCAVLLTYNKKDFVPVNGMVAVLEPNDLL